ncbi:hypothetical protein [Winogradskyella schleiferi]|uniref:hypothetical protein n=1 Tax=Winogradskyella schleiferi TaxID=2686078 RepID=UPI0015C19BD5|nr:hypothetical protein [Winogradskyella schleiferi]
MKQIIVHEKIDARETFKWLVSQSFFNRKLSIYGQNMGKKALVFYPQCLWVLHKVYLKAHLTMSITSYYPYKVPHGTKIEK